MHPPTIDNRTTADLAAETGALVSQLTGWQPTADGQGDAGGALVGIFAHYAHLVVERLNRLPDKNFLAFLNLVGAEPLTPHPARVPLTFALADGAPVDAVVPAGTQAGAPPRQGSDSGAVYETEEELLVTRARILAARTYDPWTDRTGDRLAPADDGLGPAFDVFSATEPVDHELYLACDELLADATGRQVQLDLHTPDRWQWSVWPLAWSVWRAGAWQPITAAGRLLADGRWQVTIGALPELEVTAVGGVEAHWLRARLELPLPPGRQDLQPADAGPTADRRPAPIVFPTAPFPTPESEWYIDGDEVFDRVGAILELGVTVGPGAAATPDLQLDWQYRNSAGEWVSLGRSAPGRPSAATSAAALADGTGGLTGDGRVELRIPAAWARHDHARRRGRWLRVRIASGRYLTPPTVTALTFGWRWELPRVDRIVATVEPPPEADPSAPLPPEMGVATAATVDLSRDVAPFGPQPTYNDGFHLACEPVLSQPGATVEVSLVLTNPAQAASPPVPAVRTDGNPIVAWEMPTTTGWVAVATSAATVPAAGHPLSLTADGTVSFTVPATVATAVVGGETRHWLRARLVGGHFGVAATYTGTADEGYTLLPATFRPPLLRTIRLKVTRTATGTGGGGSLSRPVGACVTVNGGEVIDRTAQAGGSGGTPFAPFTPLEAAEASLYLGLDQPVAPRPFNLFVPVEPPRPEDVAAEMLMAPRPGEPARVVWEYSSAAGWSPLGPVDGTADLTRPGIVRFVGPDDAAPRAWFGRQLHWLVARRRGGDPLFPARSHQPRLNTTWASAARTYRDEVLGSSTGQPGQRYTAANAPVLAGEQVEVGEGGSWVGWQPMVDLHGSGPDDRHYTIDRRRGEITFGDGRRGRIPTPGQSNIRLAAYRSGGGGAGNRAAGEIVELTSSPPYIDGVVNLVAAAGGFDQEPLDRVTERGPAALRHRDRAVTNQDLADLALAASPDVARVTVIVPDFDSAQLWLAAAGRPRAAHRAVPAGRVGLVVVPHGAEARPTPGLQLLDQVRRHILDRSSPSAELWVAGPEWVAVSIEARVAPVSPDGPDALMAAVRRALDAYLHPLTGGADGRGWAFGTVPRRSEVFRVLESTPGVDHIRTLAVTLTPVTSRGDVDELRAWLLRRETQTSVLTPDQREWNSWARRSLIYSAEHTVRAVLDA